MDKAALANIVWQAQQGNSNALQALYLDAHKSVYFLALKTLRSPSDAEDITQEVFITMAAKLNTLREPAAFYGWLNQITLNKCTSLLRKTQPLSGQEYFDTVIFGMEETDNFLIPDKAFDNVETRRLIMEVIDQLPAEQRLCIFCYYYQQFTIAQISENLGVNENTIKYRLSAGRDKIKAALLEKEKQDGIKLYAAPLALTPLLKMALDEFVLPQALSDSMWQTIARAAGVPMPPVSAQSGQAGGTMQPHASPPASYGQQPGQYQYSPPPPLSQMQGQHPPQGGHVQSAQQQYYAQPQQQFAGQPQASQYNTQAHSISMQQEADSLARASTGEMPAKAVGSATKGVSMAKLIPIFIIAIAIILSSGGYLVWSKANAASAGGNAVQEAYASGDWQREDNNATLTIDREKIAIEKSGKEFNYLFDVTGSIYGGKAEIASDFALHEIGEATLYIEEIVPGQRLLVYTENWETEYDGPLPDGYYSRRAVSGGGLSSGLPSDGGKENDLPASQVPGGSENDLPALQVPGVSYPLPAGETVFVDEKDPGNDVIGALGEDVFSNIGSENLGCGPEMIPEEIMSNPEWYRAGSYLKMSGEYTCTIAMVTDEDKFFDAWYDGDFFEGMISHEDSLAAIEVARATLSDIVGVGRAPMQLTLSMGMPNIPDFFSINMEKGQEFTREFVFNDKNSGDKIRADLGYVLKGNEWAMPNRDCMRVCRVYGNSKDEIPLRIYGHASFSQDEEPNLLFDFKFFQTASGEPVAVGVLANKHEDGIFFVTTVVLRSIEYQSSFANR